MSFGRSTVLAMRRPIMASSGVSVRPSAVTICQNWAFSWLMSPAAAFGAEVIGTAVLLLVIFCVTDERNHARPQLLTAASIGLTVTLLITLLGPLTMACLNPARDLGPRLFSSVAGWGALPFQVNGNGWLTVYIVAPLLGGLLGGGLYRLFFKPGYTQ